jgi:hypothetical protein
VTRTQRIARDRAQVNEAIDLFDMIGLEAGKDWALWKRPSNGQVLPVVNDCATQKLVLFIHEHRDVIAAALAAR